MLAMQLLITGGAGYWYWQKAQTDPQAMAHIQQVSALVEQGKAKLDELTGTQAEESATDEPSAAPIPQTDSSTKRGRKAAAAKAEEAIPAPPSVPPPAAPELSVEDAVVSATKATIVKCYGKHGNDNREFTAIRIDIKVDDNGSIKSANLPRKFGTGSLANCVEKAVVSTKAPGGKSGNFTLNYDLPSTGDSGSGRL